MPDTNIAFFRLDRFVVQNTATKKWIHSTFNEAEADKACLFLNEHEVKNGRAAVYDSIQVTANEMASFLKNNRSK